MSVRFVRLQRVHECTVFLNRPFASLTLPLLQSESKCEVFLMIISFHSYVK